MMKQWYGVWMVLLTCAALVVWQGCRPGGGQTGPAAEPAVAEPEFVIVLSGNWRSHIEPCGCTDKQRGGIDRRTGTINRIAPQPRSRMLLDAGPLITADDRQSHLKLEVFLRSFKTLGFDGITLTPLELAVWQEQLGMTAEECPAVIVTNLDEASRSRYPVQRWVTRSMEAGGRTLSCLVLAVCDPVSVSDPVLQEKVRLTDPVEAVAQAVAEWAPGGDPDSQLIVVMISAGPEHLPEQLAVIDGVDLIVTQGYGDEPEVFTAGPADGPLAFGMGIMGKYMARVRLEVDHVGPIRPEQLSSVEIASEFERDPRIVKHMANYQLALRAENLIADEIAMPRLPIAEDNGFVGNSACEFCHKEIYEKWSHFKHAHAMETLMDPKVDREFDPECVGCHTVAMRYEGGYRSMAETPDLADVGCEACHGPGAKHVAESAAAIALKEKPAPYREVFMACETCHTHENSPAFEPNREAYFDKIRHWKNDQRYYWK